MALIAALNNPLIVVRFLLPSAVTLTAEVLSFALVTSILFAPPRVPLLVFRRFLALARSLLLRFDNQPVLRLAFGLRRLLRAGFLLFFRRPRHALGLISGWWRRRRDAVGKPADEAGEYLAEAA